MNCTSQIIISNGITVNAVMTAVTKVTHVSRKQFTSKSRLWPAVEARMLAILIFNYLGLSDLKIAFILNRGRPAICKCRHSATAMLNYSSTFRIRFKKTFDILTNQNIQSNGK